MSILGLLPVVLGVLLGLVILIGVIYWLAGKARTE